MRERGSGQWPVAACVCGGGDTYICIHAQTHKYTYTHVCLSGLVADRREGQVVARGQLRPVCEKKQVTHTNTQHEQHNTRHDKNNTTNDHTKNQSPELNNDRKWRGDAAYHPACVCGGGGGDRVITVGYRWHSSCERCPVRLGDSTSSCLHSK